MKPRELLFARLTQAYAAAIQELGFRFSASGPHFTRKVGHVRQLISISSNRWNTDSDCSFWTMWSAHTPDYRKWYKAHWGAATDRDWLGGCADWNIPGWSRAAGVNFHLQGDSRDHEEISVLLRNSITVGIPYLQLISSWTGAAQDLLRWR